LLIGKISTAPIGSYGVHLKCAVAPRLWKAISERQPQDREQAWPTKCGKNIVVACQANDRTDQGGGKRRGVIAGPCRATAGDTGHKIAETLMISIKAVGQQDGEWIVESGNDGHALRTRPRSIAGAIAIRWG
jgi:hypothetical protein